MLAQLHFFMFLNEGINVILNTIVIVQKVKMHKQDLVQKTIDHHYCLYPQKYNH